MKDNFGAAMATLTGLVPVGEAALADIEKLYPKLPLQYLRFLREAGHGNIGHYKIYSGPIEPEEIYGADAGDLSGRVLLIGDDFGQVGVAFDRRSWRIVEIDHTSQQISLAAVTFDNFLYGIMLLRDSATVSEQSPSVGVSADAQPMTWEEFLLLPQEERSGAFQRLNPYEKPPIFEAVRLAFLEAHPQCGPPNEVFVGEVGKLGPLNGIAVRAVSGSKLRVPLWFMGMPVMKAIRTKTGRWKSAR